MMIAAVTCFLIVLSLVCFYRVIRGPSTADRIAAADIIGIMLSVVLVLLAQIFDFDVFIDVALIYAALLFADVMVMAKYFERGELHK